MSTPSNELTTTTGMEYTGRVIYIGEEPEYKFLGESHGSQTLFMGGGEDSIPSMGRIRTTVKRIEMPKTTEVSKEVSLKEIVMNSLRGLGAPILDVEIRYGEGIGLYALATLSCDARQALEYWLKIVDNVRGYNIPVFITWTGSTDVMPEEMGIYIGRALAKMNIFLATEKPIDIVKIIEEEWGF
ncbi:hypothetical protein Igag_0748 [Ignisphaera aggregans DSM 17230]|uniref:Uncharacterized protein n=1 Tax=Ignisphaera aggregans (strain DSM 17230 / JCM 13409 / AQ1.S1) TaxID=583356 RepID=E0STA0_IGNAA|nr:hypothetical protein Igag_0748 [Ignisphaera aggregans DSM 17230]